MNPYIGITDFTDFNQVQDMLKIFKAHYGYPFKRKLHVGVMMSYKTLNNLPSKWQEAFPPKENIGKIFSSDDVYNCLHYADYENHPELWKNLAGAIFYGGMGIHAIQLDMTWPDPDQIKRGVHTARKPIEIILQIGKNAFNQVNNDLRIFVKKLSEYEGVIHRVLLDKSMGQGLGMDAVGLIPFAHAVKDNFIFGIGAAGGLGPDTIDLVKPLAKIFSDLSIDAQSKLRPSGSALDPVDWEMAGAYLIKALKLLS